MRGSDFLDIDHLETKDDFIRLLFGILEPLKDRYDSFCSGLDTGRVFAHYDAKAADMEAFSRPLWGLVPLWAGGEKDGPWEELSREFAGIYQRGLCNGTDPASGGYWGDCTTFDQRFVEMAAISYGLLFAPDIVWEPLDGGQKQRLAAYLNRINENELPVCNWILFAVLVNIALKKRDMPYRPDMIERYLDGLESFYLGDGWYCDGDSGQKDYYISFAIHFYCLVYAVVMEKEDEERSALYKARAMDFANSFISWFDEDGDAIPFGRSLTYRFAQVSFFSACLMAGLEPFPVPVMKALIRGHLKSWLSRDIFDRDGILTIGYGYANLNMSERYNAQGSPYWAMKTFAFLMLPADHPFFMPDAGIDTAKLFNRPICSMPYADMLVYHHKNHTTAYVPGVYSPRGHGHIVEKYAKFAYDSKFGISVSRSQYELCECAPDCMLSFMIDGYVYVRRICEDHTITDTSVISVWSPYPGIRVRTSLIPDETGHRRIHEIESDIDCLALDSGFAIRRDDIENVGMKVSDEKNVSSVSNKYCECIVTGHMIDGRADDVKGRSYIADPGTHLLYPKTMIPAVEYRIRKGRSVLTTEIKSKWF
ncbi:MAG: DUF2264 domain-containing protein [Lachnospiraceae bacterium]|nr:DUF2264 domain-containing protein [Lachnospiraceae bacterium]